MAQIRDNQEEILALALESCHLQEALNAAERHHARVTKSLARVEEEHNEASEECVIDAAQHFDSLGKDMGDEEYSLEELSAWDLEISQKNVDFLAGEQQRLKNQVDEVLNKIHTLRAKRDSLESDKARLATTADRLATEYDTYIAHQQRVQAELSSK